MSVKWESRKLDEEPETCKRCGKTPCTCEKSATAECAKCGESPCVCEKPPCEKCGQRPCVCIKKTIVKLADGKERRIQSMVATMFFSADGRPMSAAQFMESLFGALPEFFRDEDQLRELWSEPETRKKLLEGLAEKGFGRDALRQMQKAIEAEDSDLFDVLAYIAYTKPPIPRSERAMLQESGPLSKRNAHTTTVGDFVVAVRMHSLPAAHSAHGSTSSPRADFVSAVRSEVDRLTFSGFVPQPFALSLSRARYVFHS